MGKVWRVVIVALLAVGAVMAFNLVDRNGRQPASTAIVQETPAPAAEKPAADNPTQRATKPETAPPKDDASARPDTAQAPPTTEEPAKQSTKKPESTKPPKPVPAAKPAPRPAGLPKIVDTGGENCIPCKMMVTVLDGLRSDYKGKLDVVMIVKEKDPGALKRYRTSTIPTQILYDANGREIERHFGFWAKEDILTAFSQHGINL